MGGGGAMRAATKVATYGIGAAAASGLRGTSLIHLQDQSTAALKGSKPVASSVLSSATTDDSKNTATVLISSKHGSATTSALVRKPSWEIDDWEFAGGHQDEFLLDSMNPLPRVVFGSVPTLEEAKEATSDLKQALEQEYFCKAAGSVKSTTVQDSTLLRSGHSETKACITSESSVVHSSVSKPVFQAFSLLKENPEAQSVVASLASDINVWNAVMQNEKVIEFLNKQQNSAPSDTGIDIEQQFPDDVFQNNMKCAESGKEGIHTEDSGNEFMEFVEKVKVKVADIISSLSGFFQNIFGGPSAENITVDANGNAAAAKPAMGASLMALAVLAIMVAVLKRV